MKYSKTFLWMAVLFNVCIIASNLFATKIFCVGSSIVLPGAVIIFPITYIINDCLSEVYGYRNARTVIRIKSMKKASHSKNICNQSMMSVSSCGPQGTERMKSRI